jgi:uncharacterized cofD-like protein
VRDADLVVLGPGSWFTSVLPHLLLRELGHALATTRARVVVVLNLVPQAGETDDYSPADLLRILLAHAEPYGGLQIDAVIADEQAVLDRKDLAAYARTIGARLVMSSLAANDSAERHDPVRLSQAIGRVMAEPDDREGVDAWR